MDKYEFGIKSDQIKKMVAKKEYKIAAKIADTIDWSKVKSNSMLITVADAYESDRQYDKAKQVLLTAYQRTPMGRQLAYRLSILSVKVKDYIDAEDFYRDFVEMAPMDSAQYILKYRIEKAKGASPEKLIPILEAFNSEDMDERWGYELARLYHEAGMIDKCVEQCDEVSLWFNEGDYVDMAMELKKQYKPLTKGQQERYDRRFERNGFSYEMIEEPQPVVDNTQFNVPDSENVAIDESATKRIGSIREALANYTPTITNTNNSSVGVYYPDSQEEQMQNELANNLMEVMADSNNYMQGQMMLDFDAMTDNVEEEEDKQITGQLSLEEVLRNLEARGILGESTVDATFKAMENAEDAVKEAATESAIEAASAIAEEELAKAAAEFAPVIEINKVPENSILANDTEPDVKESEKEESIDLSSFFEPASDVKEERTEEQKAIDEVIDNLPEIDLTEEVLYGYEDVTEEVSKEIISHTAELNAIAEEIAQMEATERLNLDRLGSVDVNPDITEIKLDVSEITEEKESEEDVKFTEDASKLEEVNDEVETTEETETTEVPKLNIKSGIDENADIKIVEDEKTGERLEILDTKDFSVTAVLAGIDELLAKVKENQGEESNEEESKDDSIEEVEKIESTADELSTEEESAEDEEEYTVDISAFMDDDDNEEETESEEDSKDEEELNVADESLENEDVAEEDFEADEESEDDLNEEEVEVPKKRGLFSRLFALNKHKDDTEDEFDDDYEDDDSFESIEAYEKSDDDEPLEELSENEQSEEYYQEDDTEEVESEDETTDDSRVNVEEEFDKVVAEETKLSDVVVKDPEVVSLAEKMAKEAEADFAKEFAAGFAMAAANGEIEGFDNGEGVALSEVESNVEDTRDEIIPEKDENRVVAITDEKDDTEDKIENTIEENAESESETLEEEQADNKQSIFTQDLEDRVFHDEEREDEEDEEEELSDTDDNNPYDGNEELFEEKHLKEDSHKKKKKGGLDEEYQGFLTKEEEDLFSNFVNVAGLQNKIIKTIINLTENYVSDGASTTGNIVVMGDEKSGKTTLAIDILKTVNKRRERQGRKIAKVGAEILNKKGIAQYMQKLIGSDLIIEHAGILNERAVDELVESMQYYTDDMIVVLEDEGDLLSNILSEYPDLDEMFDNQIVVKDYDINEWVNYAKNYAKDQGYIIDELGVLALYARIDDEYGIRNGLSEEDIEDIMDVIIRKASRKMVRRGINKVFSKNKYEGYYVLKESDFL